LGKVVAAAAGVLGHHSVAREGRCDIGERHGCILVMLSFVACVSVAGVETPQVT
jgi:hypothetical protein